MSRLLVYAFMMLLPLQSYGELVDPLRGASFDQVLSNSKGVYLITVRAASLQSNESSGIVDYKGHIIETYRGSRSAGEEISFRSEVKAAPGIQLLVALDEPDDIEGFKNVNVDGRHLATVIEYNRERFVFLPFRNSWSSCQPVAERRLEERAVSYFTVLLFSEGRIEGAYYRLEDLLGSSAHAKSCQAR